MSRVYCLGICVLDCVMTCDTIPQRPTKYRAERADIVVGGGATNAAIAISALGGNVSLAARLGDDEIADMIVRQLEAAGVPATNLHRAQGGRSSFSNITVDRAGERQIINFRGKDLAETTDWISPPPDTQAVLADTRWPQGMAAAIRAGRARGLPVVIDVDTPLDDCDFSGASHLAFARPALSEFSGQEDIQQALETAYASTGAWVCITDGANGTFVFDGTHHHIPGYPVEVVDTLGAGDVWHGAFALELANGSDEIEAVRFANVAAALKCERKGVAHAMPDRRTVEKQLRDMR